MAESRKARRGSNLFAIDHETILATLAEANAPLLRRRDRLIEAMGRVPVRLDTAEQVESARLFARQLEDAASEARSARLSDGQPFRAADRVVKTFFEEVEAPLRRAAQTMRARLTELALRVRPPAPATTPEPRQPRAVGVAVGGDAVVTTLSAPVGLSAPHEPAVNIPLIWEVSGFDRALIDLEALRPFLTDAAILAACRKHLEENGPDRLAGVGYRQVAAAG